MVRVAISFKHTHVYYVCDCILSCAQNCHHQNVCCDSELCLQKRTYCASEV